MNAKLTIKKEGPLDAKHTLAHTLAESPNVRDPLDGQAKPFWWRSNSHTNPKVHQQKRL